MRAIIVGIMLAMFLSALEQTIVAPALPTIGRSLSDVENLSWVVTAYLLSTTLATALFGKLSDIYGRRALMLISVSVFVLGSVACALAPTLWTLVAARALQGLGGGGILPLAQTVVADILSPRERPLVQSYSSVMFMSASILGPVLGGFLTDYIHWSMIFWINLPLGVAALLMTNRALKRLPRHERPHRLDIPGAALMVAAAVALLLALSWGGSRYGWVSPQILGPGRRLGAAVGAVRVAPDDGARAVHSAHHGARAGGRRRRDGRLLRHRHHHRPVDLHAALYRAGARASRRARPAWC